MDFKVVGSRKGITGFQVDLKVHGLNWDQVTEAFEIARKGRCDILDYMESVIDTLVKSWRQRLPYHEGEDRPREDRCTDWPRW